MLEGVKILIDRMETCPEDFLRSPGSYDASLPRFEHITAALDAVVHGTEPKRDMFVHLTAEEKTALLVAYRKMSRQAFTANVIAQLFDRQEEQPKMVVTAGKIGPIGPFGRAQVKAEGTNIAYYGSSGEVMTAAQTFNERLLLEKERIRHEIAREIEAAKLSAPK